MPPPAVHALSLESDSVLLGASFLSFSGQINLLPSYN